MFKIKRRIRHWLGLDRDSLAWYLQEGLNLGKNVDLISVPNFGSEPYLITIGDNTTISYDCAFVTDDRICRAPSTKWKKYYAELKEGKR